MASCESTPKLNYTLRRGDSTTISGALPAGVVAASVQRVRMQVRDRNDVLLLDLDSLDGERGFSADDEQWRFDVVPADTAPLKAASHYYDVEITYTDGATCTEQEGRFVLRGDITRDLLDGETPPEGHGWHLPQWAYDALMAAHSPTAANHFVTWDDLYPPLRLDGEPVRFVVPTEET